MVMALTPERLVGLLNEDSSYSIPPLLAPAPAVLSKHPTLLPGEKILLQQDATCVETFNTLVQGMLHLTTYRVIFSGANCQDADEESYCEDDPTSVARKGYIHQTHHKRKGGSATLIRFKQKAQSFQESLQASKSSLSMKSSGRSKSRDLTLASLDDSEIIQPSTDNDMNKNSCKLISVQPISSKKIQPPRGSVSHNIIISIPCTNIYDVCKLSKSSLKKEYAKLYLLADGIELLCKTLQTYKFCLVPTSSYDADKLTGIFLKYTKQLLQPYFSGSVMRKQFHARNNKSASKWFAIAYREAILVPRSCDLIYSRTSQNFYDFESEFGRLGLLASDCWKIFSAPRAKYPNVNAPSKTLVPYGITDTQMEQSIAFHGGKSYPAICWRSELFNTIMIRSGAALYRRGLFESRCQADEDYLSLVCHQNKHSCTNKLVVFTEQNRNTSGLLATPQQISGQITPKEGEAFCYPHVKFVYTDKELIPDHRTVKQSSYKLQALLASNSDDKNFLSGLAETQWLSQISELLETASLIVTALSADKSSVLIGYEEGCDRTAQLSSLSQLLLDSHYRTIDGFQVLIQKEWVSFGHMFAERCISQKSIEGHGPIFLQWLDCVWQLINQFPLSFEFNEDFLKLIADHAYSCRFGTFLCNSEQQHKEEQIESKTLSLWTWINLTIIADPEKFLNNNFRTTERILIPRYHIPSLKVWESYYAKTRIEENLQEAINLAEDQANLLAEVYKGIKNRHRGLVEKKVCVQDDGQTSVSSLETSTSSITDIEPIEEMESEIKTSSLQRANRSSERSNNNMRSTSESKSLDDLLLIRRQETQSKTRGRWGSTKFYVNKPTRKQVFKTALAVTEVKPEQPNNVRKSQMFDGLCEYLKSKGFNWSDEDDLEITSATCCGFLTKRGNVRKNWLCRWFKLDLRKNCLAYFEERENQSFPKGVIECGQIIKVYAEPRPEKSHKHKFYAVTNDRTFEFKAHSEKVMNIWIASLTSLQSRYVNVR